jgi:signal transduction histidine kinase
MVVASIGAAWLEVRRSALTAASARLEELTDQMARLLGGTTAQLRGRIRQLSEDPTFARHLAAPDARTADSVMTLLGSEAGTSVISVELWNAAGRPVLSTAAEGVPAASPAEASDLLQQVASNDTAVAMGPLIVPDSSLTSRVISRIGSGPTPNGFLVEWVRIAESPAARRQLSELVGSDARVLLANADGSLSSDFAARIPPPPVPLSSMSNVVSYFRPEAGRELALARPIAGTPWMVIVEFPLPAVLAPARATLERLIPIALVLLAVGSLLAWLMSRSLTTPISALGDAATAISSGDFSRRVAVGRRDELGVLERAFNSMAETVSAGRVQLETHAKELEGRADDLASVTAELDAALSGAPVAFAFHDLALRYRRVNHRLAAIHGVGIEDHLGRTVHEVTPILAPTIESHLRRVLETGEAVFDVEISGAMSAEPDVICHWLASFYPIRAREGPLLGVGYVMMDLTGYKLLERQLQHAQKMEAIGRLAGGVAHDFNNILTAITNFTHFAIEDLPAGTTSRSDMEQVLKAADRATILTKQLLAFSRQQVLQPQILDLSAVVRGIEPMLRRIIGEHIELRTSPAPSIWSVRADRGQIEQVILNLVVNARDAMPEGGLLTIGTSMEQLTDDYVREGHPDAAAGPHVMLFVADTGSGMDAATRSRIFEPFFSTKEPGRGTGLGLAMVYGVVRQSGGSIWVYSETGHGTSFKIYLPRFVGAQDAPEVPEVLPPQAEVPRSLILIVEDEQQVRLVARRTLEQLGHTVLEAADGQSALDIVREATSPIDLVITDLVMPGIGGRELVNRLRAGGHSPRVLFMSGYTVDAANRQSLLADSEAFVEKPFTPSSLARKVTSVLSA